MRKFWSLVLTAVIVCSLFVVPVEAEETPLVSGSYYVHRSVANTATANFNVYGYGEFSNFKTFFDNNLEPGCFYKLKYDAEMTLELDKAGVLNGLNSSFRFFKDSDNLYQHANLIRQTDKFNCSAATQYVFSDSGYIVIYSSDISASLYEFFFDFNYAVTTGVLTYKTNVVMDITDLIKLSDSEAEIYQRAYYEGYGDGQETGYNSGYSNGYSEGHLDGYLSGKDEGFEEGKNSVDTDYYYNTGFSDGVGSVDTDSYYEAGYKDGLSSGYSDAYNLGYSEGSSAGYAEGYAAAQNSFKENVEAGGVSEGESFELNFDLDMHKSNLKLSESNVTLGTVYEFNADEDVTHVFDAEEHLDYLDGSLYDSDDDSLNDEVLLDFSTVIKYYEKTYTDSFNSYRGWSYYYTGSQKLFTADPEAYAYKITVIPQNISANYTNINWFRNTVGTRSDIMAGTSDIGVGIISGYYDEFTYMITTDNLPVDIYSAFLMYFYNEGTKDVHNYAAYDVSGKLKVVITPYSRNEYAAIMSGMDDIQNDINNRFDELEENLNDNFNELTNGYDTSQGDKVNDDFQASLTDYETAENSLFNTATESLGAYEFFDFTSVPAMITGISFVTSLMTGIYTTLGGASGATGIILSILFSVMLISMVLGLSKHYMSGSKGSSSSASKPTRSDNDHIKK